MNFLRFTITVFYALFLAWGKPATLEVCSSDPAEMACCAMAEEGSCCSKESNCCVAPIESEDVPMMYSAPSSLDLKFFTVYETHTAFIEYFEATLHSETRANNQNKAPPPKIYIKHLSLLFYDSIGLNNLQSIV